MTEAKKKRMRRKQLGEVHRDENGAISMITFSPFRDNPDAPIHHVTDVGGIYIIGPNELQITLIEKIIGSRGEEAEARAIAYQIWNDRDWLRAGERFRWAMETYKVGPPPIITSRRTRRLIGH